MSNKIEFKVLGDVKDLEQQLAKGKKSFDALGKASAVAFTGLTASAYGFLNAAREQEQAIQSLNQALKNTGNYSDAASKDLQNYASALQSITLFGDETIIQAQAIIAAFGFEGETLKKLTKATLDLAQAKGMDLTSAADLVAKSVGGSTNALARYGVIIEGTVGSTQRADSAIAAINKKWSGQAEAVTGGLGSIKQMQNALSDIAEEIGGALAPSVIEVTRNIKSFAEEMKKHPEIVKTTAELIKMAIVITGLIATVWAANAAYVALSSTMIGLIPLLRTAAPLLVLGAAQYYISGAAQATWELVKAQTARNKGLKEQADFEAKMLQAHGLTKEQVMSDAAARLEAMKRQTEAVSMRIEIEKRAADMEVENQYRIREANLDTEAVLQGIRDGRFAWDETYFTQQIALEQQLHDEKMAFMQEYNTIGQQAHMSVWSLGNTMLSTFNNNMSSALSDMVLGVKSAKEAFTALGQAMVKAVVDWMAQRAVAWALSQMMQAVVKSTTGAMAAQLAAAWAPAAFAASVATLGGAVASGSAALASGLAASTALMTGTSSAGGSFAVGTPSVPEDMTANIHKGEMIVPATFSDAIRSGELSLSGGGTTTNDNGITMNFSGATFNGVTEDFVKGIFERAGEMLRNRTLVALPA